MNKWFAEGADISKLPPEHRAKISAPPQKELPAFNTGGILSGLENDDQITAGQAKELFNNLSKQMVNQAEIGKLQAELGAEEFNRYYAIAEADIKAGISPAKAFKLARHDDLVAQAIEAAKAGTEATKKELAKAVRNDESSVRGTQSADGTTVTTTGNQWIDNKETYDSERKRLAREDIRDAYKWRKDNPEFVAAERHHGDVKAISRR